MGVRYSYNALDRQDLAWIELSIATSAKRSSDLGSKAGSVLLNLWIKNRLELPDALTVATWHEDTSHRFHVSFLSPGKRGFLGQERKKKKKIVQILETSKMPALKMTATLHCITWSQLSFRSGTDLTADPPQAQELVDEETGQHITHYEEELSKYNGEVDVWGEEPSQEGSVAVSWPVVWRLTLWMKYILHVSRVTFS